MDGKASLQNQGYAKNQPQTLDSDLVFLKNEEKLIPPLQLYICSSAQACALEILQISRVVLSDLTSDDPDPKGVNHSQ